MKRMLACVLVALAAVCATALPSLAAHESYNRFDLAPTIPPPPEGRPANGHGFSNWNPDRDTWSSFVRVVGLAPETVYTVYAEGTVNNLPSQTTICVLRTNENGRTWCRVRNHEEEALAFVRVRLGNGNPAGPVVLEAAGSTDEDCIVEDGEIERTPPCPGS